MSEINGRICLYQTLKSNLNILCLSAMNKDISGSLAAINTFIEKTMIKCWNLPYIIFPQSVCTAVYNSLTVSNSCVVLDLRHFFLILQKDALVYCLLLNYLVKKWCWYWSESGCRHIDLFLFSWWVSHWLNVICRQSFLFSRIELRAESLILIGVVALNAEMSNPVAL